MMYGPATPYRGKARPMAAETPSPLAPRSPEQPQEEPVVCGVVPAMTAGFFVSTVVIAEGLYLLFDMDADMSGSAVSIVGMDSSNPYHHVQRVVLIVVGFTDVIMAAACALGLWVAGGSPIEALGSRWQGNLPGFCVGILMAWRAVVTVGMAPWLGFLVAFEPAEYPRAQVLLVTLAYVALNIYMLWVLKAAHQEVSYRSAYLQQLLAEAEAERSSLLVRQARAGGDSGLFRPKLFGCLPLEATIAAYALIVCIACSWSFFALCSDGSSRGGWAILTGSAVHEPGGELWVEALVYLIPAVFSALAISGILTHTQLAEEETTSRSRCAALVLLFLLANVLRYAAFVPLTALQLAETDICGLYTYALSHIAASPAAGLSQTHCDPQEMVTVVAVVAVLLLDAYCISGVFRLWQAYREGSFFAPQASREAAVKVNGFGDYGDYGVY